MGNKKKIVGTCEFNEKTSQNENYLACKDMEIELGKPNILLHSCCGPCSSAVIERLAPHYNITIYFYNPNVTDYEEYIKRRDSQIYFINEFNKKIDSPSKVKFVEGPYDKDEFIDLVKNNTLDKEGGPRCSICFKQRLEASAIYGSMHKYDAFATTLTISPHKDYEIIGKIGKFLEAKYGITFLNENFKKKGGFQRSIELSKKYNLYRQNYCGCEYSKR